MDWKAFYKKLIACLFCFLSFNSFCYAHTTVFIEPDDGYPPVIQQINSTKQSLDMTMYILKDWRIIQSLIAAKKRGVTVRILLEKTPYGNHSGQALRVRKLLLKNGITVKWTSPNLFYLTHEKAFDVDQQRLIVMTMNQTYSAYHFNREYGIVDSSPADIQEYEKVFNGDWRRSYPAVSSETLVWSPNNASCKLIDFIDSAQRSISIEAEELSDKAIMNLLLRKARQGIKVRVILALQKNEQTLQYLIKGGVRIHALNKKPLYMHAKLMILDGKKAFIGSENLTSTSLQMNRELGILLTQAEDVDRLAQSFLLDWKNFRYRG